MVRNFLFFLVGGGLMIQILFHENLLLGILGALGWGFFSAMVAMTCTHDARCVSVHYTYVCVHVAVSSGTKSCENANAVIHILIQ